MNITVIVLNWNGRAFIGDCLEALLAQTYPSYSITVVDNASSDDSVAYISERFPEIEIIRSFRNLGYAGGNNLALRRASTELIALVNPDVVLSANWLEVMIERMLNEEDIGIAGCKLLYPESNLIQHAGGYITHPQALPGHHGLNEKDLGQFDMLSEIDYAIGAGMCIRRRVIEEAGFFDEGFFLFFEDADLCYRIRNAGYRIVFIPDAIAHHSESKTTRKGSTSYFRRFHTSRWRWLLKHFTANEIIDETMQAESNWLSICDLQERSAAGHAYATTLARFDEIVLTRETDPFLEQEFFSEASQVKIRQGLGTLHKQATGEQALKDLEDSWHVRGGDFKSKTPVVGTLLASIRRIWNEVESAPYVQQILDQQNTLNYTLVEQLSETFQGSKKQASELRLTSKELGMIAAELEETTRRLRKLRKRIDANDRERGST